MNPTSGSDILSYRGNAALGLNTEGLSSFGETNTDFLNQALANLSFQQLQKNKVIYEQKVKQRDATLAQIASGELDIPEVFPEDRPDLMDSLENVKKILLDNNGDVTSNIDVNLQYKDALSRWREKKVLATHKFIELNRQAAEIAQTTRPDLQRSYQKHYDGERKQKLGTVIKPYQHMLDFTEGTLDLDDDGSPVSGIPNAQYDAQKNIDITQPRATGGVGAPTAAGAAKAKIANTQKYYDIGATKTDANYNTTTSGVLNYEKMLNASTSRYLKNEGTGNFYEMQLASQAILANPQLVDQINKAATQYQAIAPTMGYKGVLPQPIPVQRDQQGNILTDEQGNVMTTDSPAEIRAKFNLLKLKPTVTETGYDKNAAAAALNKAKIGELGARGAANMIRARGSAGVNAARARYWNRKTTDLENVQNINNIYDDVIARGEVLTVTPAVKPATGLGGIIANIGSRASQKPQEKTVVLADNLPEGFTKVLGGVDKKGEPIELLPLDLGDNKSGYLVEPSGFLVDSNGGRFSDDVLTKGYKKAGYASKQELIDFLMKPVAEGGGGYTTETELVGQDSKGKRRRGTAQSTIQALRALNNKNKSGKDDSDLF